MQCSFPKDTLWLLNLSFHSHFNCVCVCVFIYNGQLTPKGQIDTKAGIKLNKKNKLYYKNLTFSQNSNAAWNTCSTSIWNNNNKKPKYQIWSHLWTTSF